MLCPLLMPPWRGSESERILSRNLAVNDEIPPSEMLPILFGNLVVEREPICGISEWAARMHPYLLNLTG